MTWWKNFGPIFVVTGLVLGAAGCAGGRKGPISSTEVVNPFSTNHVVLPIHQVLDPAGLQVELPGMRPQVMALSPDGKILVVSGKTHELVIIDPATGKIRQRVDLPSDRQREGAASETSARILEPDREGQASFTGLVFSPDGSRIYLSNVNGSIKVFSVGTDSKVAGISSLPLPPAGQSKDIPSGLAVSNDGRLLYVVLNVSNRLMEMEAASGKVLRFFDVGNAPYGVVLNRGRAYVSNWGGRRPEAGNVTGPIGAGARVRVDPVRFIASEGSVSRVDLKSGVVLEIPAGLHASGIAASPDGRHVVVANANSDTVSVIDGESGRVVETISLRWHSGDFFGASPNALSFSVTGRRLYICNGTQNAVAVVDFRPGRTRLLGLIPTGWFPGAIVVDGRRDAVYVSNIKGFGSGRRPSAGQAPKFTSHEYFGSVSLIPIPDRRQLARWTKTVLEDYRESVEETVLVPARPGVAARPVPERIGEPSVFQHVVYVIKENRTYDQVLGDLKEGNGAPGLCVFGEEITPNQHKLSRDFVLLDNTYCSGILSADGHQWADTAFATDYMEKSFAGFPRSYPDGMDERGVDALAYSPTGFIWDNVLAHGKTLRDYGEYTIGTAGWKDRGNRKAPQFLDYYRDFINGTGLTRIGSKASIQSLAPHMNTNTIGWDLNVPDIFRAAKFIEDLHGFERDGAMPNLSIICLPNDHTSGTKAGLPSPSAQVADNDLAFGRIVEAISRSRFWADTCIFAIEDDPQNGFDHVSSFRTTAYVVSPYTQRGKVIHENYNHTSILRTIELILGLPPMNQMDATATPMSACFTGQPDFTPYTALPNRVPLDSLNPPPSAIQDREMRKFALASARMPLDEADKCPEDLLNRILWAAQKGPRVPYPAWAITALPKGFDRD